MARKTRRDRGAALAAAALVLLALNAEARADHPGTTSYAEDGGIAVLAPKASRGSSAPGTETTVRECSTVVGDAVPEGIGGAATPSNIVVASTRNIAIFNKNDCASVMKKSLLHFFGDDGGFDFNYASDSLLAPRVLYDPGKARCYVVTRSKSSANGDQYLYIAASTNSACTTWRRIRYRLREDASNKSACKFKNDPQRSFDETNVGYNRYRLVVALDSFTKGALMSIDKTALTGKGKVASICFTKSLPPDIAPSIVGDTNSTMVILSSGDGGVKFKRWHLHTSSGSPAYDTLSSEPGFDVDPWSPPPDAAQPNGQKLDTGDGRFAAPSKQIGGYVWNVHTIYVSGYARLKFYKLSVNQTTPRLAVVLSTSRCSSGENLFAGSMDTYTASNSATAFVTATHTCPGKSNKNGYTGQVVLTGPNGSATGWTSTVVQRSKKQIQIGSSTTNVPCNDSSQHNCGWGAFSSTQIDPGNAGWAWSFAKIATGKSMYDWKGWAGLVEP